MHTAESIRKLLDAGLLEPANVSAAAALGNEPSLDACNGPLVLDAHYRTGVEQVCSLLEYHQCLDLANNVATRALVTWQKYCPTDHRPEKVFKACCEWIVDNAPNDFRVLSELASNASCELDYPELTEDTDPDRARALHAADAISHFAMVIDLIQFPQPPLTVAEVVAWMARLALRASPDPIVEKRTINEELVSLLLTPKLA